MNKTIREPNNTFFRKSGSIAEGHVKRQSMLIEDSPKEYPKKLIEANNPLLLPQLSPVKIIH